MASSEKILSAYSAALNIGKISALSMRHDTIEYSRQEQERYERDPDGIIEHVKSWFGTRFFYGYKLKTITEHRKSAGTQIEEANALLWFAGFALEQGEENPCIIFHGGEPLLIPVRQYRKCLDELHDSQRRDVSGKATYSRVMANIAAMQANGLWPSGLMVLTHNSLNAGLEFLKDFAAMSLPLKINPLYSAGEAVHHKNLLLESGEYAEYLIRVFEYVVDNEIDISLLPIEYILHGLLNSSAPRGCVFSGKCSRSFMCVSHDGNIYPCGQFADAKTNCIGNVHKGGITESGREECRRCKHLALCSGGCIARNGAMCSDFVKFMDYLYGEGLRKYKSCLLTKREEILRRLSNAV